MGISCAWATSFQICVLSRTASIDARKFRSALHVGIRGSLTYVEVEVLPDGVASVSVMTPDKPDAPNGANKTRIPDRFGGIPGML